MYRIENISFTYPKTNKKILDNISYTFEKNKVYAIKGLSGAGKSTLMSVISGLEEKQEGVLFFDDQLINNIDKDRKKLISVIFQSYNLIESYSVEDNLKIGMYLSTGDISIDKIIDVLEKVGLSSDYLKRGIYNLSGGEQQRIGIARALLCDTPIIIADEPTGNLDEKTQKVIFKLLKQIAYEEDKIIIIVTHSSKIAEQSDVSLNLIEGKLE